MNNKRIVVAVDGPAGAGKSTISKRVAKILNLEYIDTGAMYRALTLKILRKGINPKDVTKIMEVMEETIIFFKNNHIYLDGTKVDEEIRKNIVNKHVSEISKIGKVREKMVDMQRKLSESTNVIMDGRDIGTVVLPHANYKFFITASVEERARRRYKELLERGEKNISYDQVLSDIKERDRIDSTRQIAPLKKSPDALVIDTTNKTIDECVNQIIGIIEGR
ncbi:MAG: (d)CMP kinase [Tissierellia bacterium]|nr:(d)CMP kinase [Tissierellia bacterium]